MNWGKNVRIQKLQNRHHMVGKSFSVLEPNERRKYPWLGGAWFEPGQEKNLQEYLLQYQAETERMLKANPKLRLV